MNVITISEGESTMKRLTGWRRALAIAASSPLGGSLGALPAGPVAAVGPESGIVCTTGVSGSPTFTLTAKSGYVAMPDGNTIFTWSYAPGGGSFQLPGPNLCVNQGDTVTIVLNNTLPEPVSIVLPGIDGVMANGVPSQPVFSGTTLTSLAPPAPATNGSMTYSFLATRPGTFLYQSGTDPEKQVQMGLYGALVIRPTSGCTAGPGEGCAYDGQSIYNANTEYVLLLSEIDPFLHQAVERRNRPFDPTAYRARYWLINGRAFPDTIAPNGAAWLPSQPYSSLVHLHPKDTSNPDPALVRYLNAGVLNHPFHPHGNHGRVVGRDGSALEGAAAQDISYEKFTVLVGSGQTWDVLYNWTDVESWNPSTNPIPSPGVPQLQNLTFKDSATWYSGSPYLGYQDELPVGTTSYNQCGEYYHVWHSHALDEAANFDAGFGGMLTLERIDPPLPNTCP